MKTDLCYRSATKVAAGIREGRIQPVEVIEALAERIERLNPRLDAYVTLDLKNARRDAEPSPPSSNRA
jgi:Asp-tRNA(Asn)/Glu-tRNA(Gln) amidotransferase A subunit family amidase